MATKKAPKEPKKKKTSLADIEAKIEYLGGFCNALSKRLEPLELYVNAQAKPQELTAPAEPQKVTLEAPKGS
jgi:hypothetical protein